MRFQRSVSSAASALAAATLCACSGVLGLAHGDPGHAAPPPPQVAGRDSATASDTSTPAVPAAAGAVSAVTVTFSERAQQVAALDARLSPDEVATAVESELQAHQMYEPASADVRRSLAITVQDFTNSLAGNASLLGFSFHNVELVATVQVHATGMVEQPPFEVHARARISTRDVGATGGSLAGLYAQFAALTVADLRDLASPLPSQSR
jgi:hypothetical protein